AGGGTPGEIQRSVARLGRAGLQRVRILRLKAYFVPPLSHFAAGVFRGRSSAVQVRGDQMAAPEGTSDIQSSRAPGYGDRPPARGVFDDADLVRGGRARAAGRCPEQFR